MGPEWTLCHSSTTCRWTKSLTQRVKALLWQCPTTVCKAISQALLNTTCTCLCCVCHAIISLLKPHEWQLPIGQTVLSDHKWALDDLRSVKATGMDLALLFYATTMLMILMLLTTSMLIYDLFALQAFASCGWDLPHVLPKKSHTIHTITTSWI